MRILIYVLLFIIGYLVVKVFIGIQRSYRQAFKKNEEKKSPYKNIEEAEYREIRNDEDKKNEQE
ncbi:MAG: hypothetical protein EHM47_16760 [Ignavibacteriales bacterium]|jgi:hypothetical protein|nr:MAG: hypothetical protein EHM47_16760 [Ignavibacteriales bacterium]